MVRHVKQNESTCLRFKGVMTATQGIKQHQEKSSNKCIIFNNILVKHVRINIVDRYKNVSVLFLEIKVLTPSQWTAPLILNQSRIGFRSAHRHRTLTLQNMIVDPTFRSVSRTWVRFASLLSTRVTSPSVFCHGARQSLRGSALQGRPQTGTISQ